MWVPLYSPPAPSLGTSRCDWPAIRRLAGARWPSCRREVPILYSVAWPAPALAVLVAKPHSRWHPRFAVDVVLALVVGNAGSAPQKCETQCAPPAVPESRFGTEKRSRTLPAPRRIADSGPAAVLPQLHQRCRGGADDSGAHTAFLLCVRVFGDGLWVSAARREPLVASRLVAPLPTTAAVVRSLSSILQCLARAARSFLPYSLLPHRQTNRFTGGDNYILQKKCLDAKQIQGRIISARAATKVSTSRLSLPPHFQKTCCLGTLLLHAALRRLFRDGSMHSRVSSSRNTTSSFPTIVGS